MKVAQSIKSGRVTVEVQHLLGDATFRAVSMSPTEGLRRGQLAELLPGPISVPVGRCTLGRIFNVLGEPVDGKGPVKSELRRPIHRSAPCGTSWQPWYPYRLVTAADVLAEHPDRLPHVFGRLDSATGSAILTFTGTYSPRSGSLWLSDVAHHHLAVGIVALLVTHLLSVAELPRNPIASIHFDLAVSLAALGTASSFAANHLGAFTPYAFLANDLVAHRVAGSVFGLVTPQHRVAQQLR